MDGRESTMETMGLGLTSLFTQQFQGKKVLITGHTGFKGAWLSLWLDLLGAEVIGYSLLPQSDKDMYVRCELRDHVVDIYGDVRDRSKLHETFSVYHPEIVFHLAAQPLTRHAYDSPLETLETNVMGTANILDEIRRSDSVQASVIITTDNCYENKEQIWGYRETDPLGGDDPYSASKACAELITAAYRQSYFSDTDHLSTLPGVASVRAGNVIGGGDWSLDRMIPDCIRALQEEKNIEVRNPQAIWPWQLVLEPLYGYLLLAAQLLIDPVKYSGAWNFGPDFSSMVPVGQIVNLAIELWGSGTWNHPQQHMAIQEENLLNLDCTKAKTLLGWKPLLSLQEAMEQTISWYRAMDQEDMYAFSKAQVMAYDQRVRETEKSE